MEQKPLEVDTQSYISALQTQRNAALNEAAMMSAAVEALSKKVAELEGKLKAAEKEDGG